MLAGSVPASAAEFYVGRWAAEAAWCKNARGEGDEVPIVLRARALSGLENECRFTSLTKSGNRWQVQANCRGEGRRGRDHWIMERRGERLAIFWRGDRTPVVYTKCQ